jgi:hypothetical protein
MLTQEGRAIEPHRNTNVDRTETVVQHHLDHLRAVALVQDAVRARTEAEKQGVSDSPFTSVD